jgi:hypothetical protein
VWIGNLASQPEPGKRKSKEIVMWNSNIPTEFNPGINSAHESGGVAPLQYDLTRQLYLEKRRAHAEADRNSKVRAVWTAMSHWAYDTSNQHCQKALQWFNVRMGRSVPETSRS